VSCRTEENLRVDQWYESVNSCMHAFFSILTSTWLPNIIGLLRIERHDRSTRTAASHLESWLRSEGSKFFWILLSRERTLQTHACRSRRLVQAAAAGPAAAVARQHLRYPTVGRCLARCPEKEGRKQHGSVVRLCVPMPAIDALCSASSRGSGPRATPCADNTVHAA
jgi:hypothetical protein